MNSLVSRIWWHANRTPLAKGAKAALRLWESKLVSERRALARSFELNARENNAAQALALHGWVRVDELLEQDALASLSAAAHLKLSSETSPATQHNTSKKFWTRLLDADMTDGALPSDNPFVRFALQRPLAKVLAARLGELPYLDYVLLTLSRHSESALESSQLWHRDYDDVHTIKLFVYLTDVAAVEDGPFTFIAGPHSDQRRFSWRSHRSDESLGIEFVHAHKQEVTGERLSAFLVETSRCLHMGSRMAPGHERLLYTATYLTLPRLFPDGKPRFIDKGVQDSIEKALLRTA